MLKQAFRLGWGTLAAGSALALPLLAADAGSIAHTTTGGARVSAQAATTEEANLASISTAADVKTNGDAAGEGANAASNLAVGTPKGANLKGTVQYGDGPNGIVKNGKPATRGWKSLFDGKTLDGWMGEKGYWQVKDGAILGDKGGSTPHHHYLFSDKDYSDFELHIDAKMTGYNSGVCCRIHPVSYDDVPGYQVDMGDGFWGCLWDEHHRQVKIFDYPKDEADKILHKDDWNHYYVRMVGRHVTIFLNGVKTADGDDPGGYDSGPLGFQLCHGGNTVASFKNIYIKTLKPATKGTAPRVPDVVVP